uniref:Lipase domain-containing protein n=1 Tax=Romanomermis culicivorax TaxID=13658 RepID=A0A915JQH4_ROMCU
MFLGHSYCLFLLRRKSDARPAIPYIILILHLWRRLAQIQSPPPGHLPYYSQRSIRDYCTNRYLVKVVAFQKQGSLDNDLFFKQSSPMLCSYFFIFFLIISYWNVSYAGFGGIVVDKKCFRSLIQSDSCGDVMANYSHFPDLPVAKDLFGTVCCYDESIGCFNNDPKSIWGCLIAKPRCIKSLKPEFAIYSPENGLTLHQHIDFFNLTKSIEQLRMRRKRKFYVVIHGFGNEWPKWWMKPMVELLISKRKANVMIVRWSIGTQKEFQVLEYFKAVANMRSMAAAVAKVLNALIAKRKIRLRKVAIIGYSLGAHMAGLIGARLPGLPYIFGLDPAGPMFTCHDPLTRLDPNDADKVVVLHTNGDSLVNGGLGTMQPMGALDLYANGGKFQPGCPKRPMKDLGDIAMEGLQGLNETMKDIMCSHARVMKLFLQLLNRSEHNSCNYTMFPCINHKHWESSKCSTCPYGMGDCPIFSLEDIEKSRGTFFFNTRSDGEGNMVDCGFGKQFSIRETPTENLTAKVSNDKAFVLRPNIKDIETISIKYDKGNIETVRSRNYESNSWKLLDCQIIVLDGHKSLILLPTSFHRYNCKNSIIIRQDARYLQNVHLYNEISYEL